MNNKEEQNKSEKERLEFCIQRYDHFFDSVHNKSTVYLTLSTFVLGGLVAGFTQMNNVIEYTTVFKFIYSIPIFFGLITVCLIIYASIPFLSKNSKSIFYFGGVAARMDEDFCSKSRTITQEEEMEDLRNQAHVLASGLLKKYDKLKIAGYLLLAQLISLFTLFIFITINLK